MMVLLTLIAGLYPTRWSSSWAERRSEPIWVDVLRWLGISVFTMHTILLGSVWLGGLTSLEQAPWVMLSLFSGYLIADLLSGIVHWLSDTYGSRDTPIYGRLYAIPFRDHHIDPEALCREGFVESHGINALSASAMLALAYYLQDFTAPDTRTLFVAGLALSTSVGVLIAGQSHKWAHQDEVPWLVYQCQEHGILANPKAHDLHHDGNHDDHFCIASGWWNEPLARIQFYRHIERLLARTLNIKPSV